jgi:hypothetical protein
MWRDRMYVPSKCTIVRTMGRSANVSEVLSRRNRDKTQNYPQQGIYTIWYFEAFLRSPDDFEDGLLQGKANEKIWLNMTANIFREDIIRTVLDLLKGQGIDVVGMETEPAAAKTGTASEPSFSSPPQCESPYNWKYRKGRRQQPPCNSKPSFQDTCGKESRDDANNGVQNPQELNADVK